ncbi:MAG: AMP-binding protein [Pseudomonadota bacterium]
MTSDKIEAENPNANLKDYRAAKNTFSWEDLEKEFTWSSTGKVNIVHEAVDRWAEDPIRGALDALVFEKNGKVERFTYKNLKEKSAQLANFFQQHGLQTGDRLFIFLPPCPEIFLAMLACARLGVIYSPLYSTLNYQELEVRCRNGEPKAFLTHPHLAEQLPLDETSSLDFVFLTEGPALNLKTPEIIIAGQWESLGAECQPKWVSCDTELYLLYTSGSTGPPKGVVHSHQDMVGHLATGRYALDLNPGTVFWADADPAWVTGTVYAAFSAWLCGAASVALGDQPSASTCYRALEQLQVEVWYTTPSRLNLLVEAGEDLPGRYDLSRLRHIATVGETLSAETFHWIGKNLGLTPHETWWMTETGMISLANFPSLEVKPGSMGRPFPGVEAAILDGNGLPQPALTLGELALKAGWPAMTSGIWRDERRYRDYFRFQGWFLTGDMALCDEDGYFFHQGRNDDLIKVGQRLIGPFEIEHILARHPAVGEAAVISKLTPSSKMSVKAFVTLKSGLKPSTRLNLELKDFVRANLSSEPTLFEVGFIAELPKTRSGKLLRRVLRAKEMALPRGDAAELEE